MKTYIRKRLSVRISLWIVLFAAAIFLVALGVMFRQARAAVRQEAISRATQILDNTVLRVTDIFDRAEAASNMTQWLVLRHPKVADSMFVYSRGMLQNNPDFFSCSIAFEPNHFPQYGRFFSAYSKKEGDGIRTIQGGSEHYQYFYMDWYLLPRLLDKPCWTEPYMDLDVPTNTMTMMASFCRPLKDSEGKFIGVVSTGLSLDWLSKTISSVKPYPNSYSIMVGHGGTFFVHPDSTKLFNQSIFTETLTQADTTLSSLGHAMQAGQEGYRKVRVDGKRCFVFFKPIEHTGWSAAIVCPERDIFSGFYRLESTVIIIVLVGLLLIMLLFSRIISRELKPLHMLAGEAESIASGDFEHHLPDDGRADEIGQLTHAFSNMQRSLVSYIDKIQQTSAAKAAIENELKVASDIQMSMVPRIFPAFPNRKDIDLYASMTPAKEVGGDLYDYFIQHERLYFCVGDVSGKGVPASLFMAVTRNLFRIYAQQEHTPEQIAGEINKFLSTDNNQLMFVTMFLGMVDLTSGRMDFCNCGHNPPVLAREGKPVDFLPIRNTNRPLGILEEGAFVGESVPDIRGQVLLVYTDGLSEAESPEKVLFGDRAVLQMMSQMGGRSSKEIVVRLRDAVTRHRAGCAPNDDLTLLCLQLL